MHIFEIFIIEFSYTFDLKNYFLNCANDSLQSIILMHYFLNELCHWISVQLMGDRTRAPLLMWPWKVYLEDFPLLTCQTAAMIPVSCEGYGIASQKGVNVKELCTYYEECRSKTSPHELTSCSLFLVLFPLLMTLNQDFFPHFLNSTNKSVSYLNLWTNIPFALGLFTILIYCVYKQDLATCIYGK